MSITSDFSKFKKIDAHSHIGTFGSPFNIHFNADLLLKQMEEFNIEKTILCSDGPHTNEETGASHRRNVRRGYSALRHRKPVFPRHS